MRSARAFARVLYAMYASPTPSASRREAAQCAMLDIVEGFSTAASRSTSTASNAAAIGSADRAVLEALHAYVSILSSWLDAVLAHPPSSSAEPRSRAKQMDARIATEALLALSRFALVIYAPDGGAVEGYEKVLYGLLDVLVALSGVEGVSGLFKLRADDMPAIGNLAERNGQGEKEAIELGCAGVTAEEAAGADAWWMTTLESVCREADAETVRATRAILDR